MRCLNRNKRVVYFKNYLGVEQILDDNGLRTGEYKTSYGELKCEKMNVSASNGVALEMVFGIDSNYSRMAVTSNIDCELDEYSIVWVSNNIYPAYEDGDYAKGSIVIYEGELYRSNEDVSGEWDSSKWDELPFEYTVAKKAESLNSISYGFIEVTNNGSI